MSGGGARAITGGGEMGALMRSIDWSTTPVGPAEGWPQSLRTALSILLDTGFPMYIAWGASFTQFYNDAYRPILGSTKHPRAMGISTRETFAEIWDIIGPMFADVMRGNAVNVTDFLLPLDRHGFAEECYFIFSYSPIRQESGDVGGVLVTVTETTERVLAGRRLRVLQELAVRTQNAPTAQAACRIAAGVLETDPADLPFALLYLIDEHDGEARLAGIAGHVGSTDPDAWPLREVCATGRAQVVDGLRGANGDETKPDRALVLPVNVPGAERCSGVLVTGLSPRLLFDETYRSFMELVAGHVGTAIASARALEQAKARAEALAEIDRAKTAFFSNISHEFRTPLTLMLGPMEDARTRGALAGEDLDTALRNALRLQKLVNALLDFSRIEAGRMQATYVATDLARFTAELAGMFESTMQRAGLRFEVRCAPLAEPVYVDRDMYEKILLNLLSNALKFTFAGSVHVLFDDHRDHVELRVRDTGVGVAPENLPRLFERFHRIEASRARTHEGSGIGLAFVSELVKLHGGTVEVESKLGDGTTFTITIPKGRDHLPAERIGEASALVLGTASSAFVEEVAHWIGGDDDVPLEAGAARAQRESAGRGRVLVVDDNADMRRYVCRVLETDLNVDVAADGAAALGAARRAPPDLVVTDIMMPGMDGFALLRAMRADPRLSSIPVIMLSARAGEESRVEGLQAGADDYLVKPFSARELVARVRTHLELSRLRRDAEAQATKLELLLEQAPAVICVLSGPDHVYRLANPAYRETVGNRPLLGLPIRRALPELEGQGIFELLDRVYESGERFLGSEVPVALVRGDGHDETIWNYVYQPYRDGSGDVEGVMVFGFEITDQVLARRRAEELTRQLQVSEAQAARANRAKDEFFAVLGHELRNPLSPILTALEIMRLRGATASKEQMIIERQTKHMIRLVDDLLDVSRIAGGKIELRKKHVEVAEIIARGLEMASPLLEQRQHHLSLDVQRHGLVVDGDPDRLAQILGNLLTNAAKYTEQGGTITVSATAESGHVVIRVKDTGVGIVPEILPHVFDMFVQERQAIDRSRGGLGLGLTITRNLVELHGGRISAHSEGRNRGAEFVLSLPRVEEGPRAIAAPQSDAQLQSRDVAAGRRVLVVDDNSDSAALIAEVLQHAGFSVRVAHDGIEALDVAARFEPHVALLDIGLPVMDGYELARHLQARGRVPEAEERLRLIAVTGYGQEADIRRSKDAGFDAHLTKPVDAKKITDLVAKLTTARA